jgi:hypothetical protein
VVYFVCVHCECIDDSIQAKPSSLLVQPTMDRGLDTNIYVHRKCCCQQQFSKGDVLMYCWKLQNCSFHIQFLLAFDVGSCTSVAFVPASFSMFVVVLAVQAFGQHYMVHMIMSTCMTLIWFPYNSKKKRSPYSDVNIGHSVLKSKKLVTALNCSSFLLSTKETVVWSEPLSLCKMTGISTAKYPAYFSTL